MRQILAIYLFISVFFALPVEASCSITTTGGNFGTVTTQNNINNVQLADISITCDSSTETYRIGIDAGVNLSGTRQLKHSNGDLMSYQLFQGNSSLEWGDKELSPTNYPQDPLIGSGSQNYQLYASATTKDQAPAGEYTDTVNISLEANGITTSTATQISLQLEAFCTLDASNVTGEFGSYPLGSPNLSNINLGALRVNCPNTIAYKIGLGKGLHLTSGVRQMALNNHLIAYTLKQGNGGAEWGDKGLHAIDTAYTETFSTADALSSTGTGVVQSFDLYGDALIANVNAVGLYTDTLTVTLVW
jgi:spore coat protein U-like protein